MWGSKPGSEHELEGSQPPLHGKAWPPNAAHPWPLLIADCCRLALCCALPARGNVRPAPCCAPPLYRFIGTSGLLPRRMDASFQRRCNLQPRLGSSRHARSGPPGVHGQLTVCHEPPRLRQVGLCLQLSCRLGARVQLGAAVHGLPLSTQCEMECVVAGSLRGLVQLCGKHVGASYQEACRELE